MCIYIGAREHAWGLSKGEHDLFLKTQLFCLRIIFKLRDRLWKRFIFLDAKTSVSVAHPRLCWIKKCRCYHYVSNVWSTTRVYRVRFHLRRLAVLFWTASSVYRSNVFTLFTNFTRFCTFFIKATVLNSAAPCQMCPCLPVGLFLHALQDWNNATVICKTAQTIFPCGQTDAYISLLCSSAIILVCLAISANK